MASSNKYRDGQDYFSEFNKEKIRDNPGGKIKKTELIEEFKQWYISHFNKSIPKGIELYEFMDKEDINIGTEFADFELSILTAKDTFTKLWNMNEEGCYDLFL